MAAKNETTVLALTLVITLGLLGIVYWWLSTSGIIAGSFGGKGTWQVKQSNYQTFSQVPKVPLGLFSYGGSTTWAPIRKDVDPAVQTVFPEFQLRYTDPTIGAPGSGSGIKMLIDNQLAFSQSSRPIKNEEYQKASKRGFTLREVPVALDGIAIAVHPDLNVPGLTVAQIKDIYTGKITNWKSLGGPDLSITPYSRRLEEGGTVEFFSDNVLSGEKFGTNVQYIPTTTQALQTVARNNGGIYYASAPEVVGQCTVKPLPLGKTSDTFVPPYQEPFIPLSECPKQRNQLNAVAFQKNQYPITRRLFVIVKHEGNSDQQAGEAYANLMLTNQGQELIAKAGFVRIR
ncbi:phosphate ABC transporter substrate-binding protein [Scytonema hofmannii PCC 7110]|uniref:Phosphate ABC transporter substrate-binding protein n=1 Tax=Scytonema hofmannii PCC 7110 TaxID=128403 RepID=A0A139X426_9CYAN|nr:PstS family phosphate ABC transporter substrate-binding protein [Scytonema hofmannii]KYC39459.1 phosphate ABC transporter substrate-binding protein [Scytonema hofmannii PCC 7110]